MSEIKMPTNADEAAAMVLIGMSWLENNAPEKLTGLHREIRAEAGRDGFFKGVAWILDIDVKDISAMVAEEAADQYADSIRKGEVK